MGRDLIVSPGSFLVNYWFATVLILPKSFLIVMIFVEPPCLCYFNSSRGSSLRLFSFFVIEIGIEKAEMSSSLLSFERAVELNPLIEAASLFNLKGEREREAIRLARSYGLSIDSFFAVFFLTVFTGVSLSDDFFATNGGMISLAWISSESLAWVGGLAITILKAGFVAF